MWWPRTPTQHKLDEILRRLDNLTVLLVRVSLKETRIMASIDDVIAELSETTSVVESVGIGVDAAIVELARLEDLIVAGGTDPAKMQAAIDAIRASKATLVAKRDALATAVAAGT